MESEHARGVPRTTSLSAALFARPKKFVQSHKLRGLQMESLGTKDEETEAAFLNANVQSFPL